MSIALARASTSSSIGGGSAPASAYRTIRSRKNMSVGIERMSNAAASSRCSSVFTFPNTTSACRSEAASNAGANARHGAHQGAQKSTMSMSLLATTLSKLSLVSSTVATASLSDTDPRTSIAAGCGRPAASVTLGFPSTERGAPIVHATPPCRYRGRFAPSPTGSLHIGSLVAAVASYVDARASGGEWLVRMEDLDPPRAVPGAAADIVRTLQALGLDWDGAVLHQSTRAAAYAAALERL